MCLQEVQLGKANESMPEPTVLESRSNIAPVAAVSVSSTHPDYSTRGLTDGCVGGFPVDISKEWCTNAEKGSAMVRLTWAAEHTIDRIWLFDRPNSIDQITSAVILFDDGTTMKAGALPDDAKKGLELRFAPKKVRWLVVLVDTVKDSTQNIGLAEIAVFEAK